MASGKADKWMLPEAIASSKLRRQEKVTPQCRMQELFAR